MADFLSVARRSHDFKPSHVSVVKTPKRETPFGLNGSSPLPALPFNSNQLTGPSTFEALAKEVRRKSWAGVDGFNHDKGGRFSSTKTSPNQVIDPLLEDSGEGLENSALPEKRERPESFWGIGLSFDLTLSTT